MHDLSSFIKENFLDLIFASSKLEGLPFTRAETSSILRGDYTNNRGVSIVEVLNIKRAYDFVAQTLNYPVNFNIVLHIHSLLMKGLLGGNEGVLRAIPVIISGTSYTPTMIIRDVVYFDINSICTADISPVEKACRLFCYIARNQIFRDGNKRTATLVANMVLLQSNVGVFVVPVRGLKKFVEELLMYYETENFDAFYKVFVKNIRYIGGRKK